MEEAGAILRRLDPDRYFADLFLPEEKRGHVFVLHAFNAEIGRIREAISEPLPGEIRLEWWRDTLARGASGGHPLAGALLRTIESCRLPLAAFDAMLEARIFDLYDDPMPDMAAFEAYAGATASVLFQLAAIVLADGTDPVSADASGHAGVAYALTGLLRSRPHHARAGQIYLPLDILARAGADPADLLTGRATKGVRAGLAELRALARKHLRLAQAEAAGLPAPIRAAFLPLALVEPTLRRLESIGAGPLASPAELPQWRRQWILWRAARKSADRGG